MAIHSPCKDCLDRQIGCHSACERYKLYQQQNGALSQKRIASCCVSGDYMEHLQLSKRRMRESKGHLK